MKFSGFFAWWLWRTIYLMKLPGLERKIRVALDWTLDLVFPRDIVYLRSLHTAHCPGVADEPPDENFSSVDQLAHAAMHVVTPQ